MSVLFVLGDCREVLRTFRGDFYACVTSPPYWCQRDYGHKDQIGLELRVGDYVDELVRVFREVRRLLVPGGALWLNLGDTFHGAGYSNHRVNGERWAAAMNGDKRRSRQQDLIRANPELKPKDLVGVPWRVALALQADGWWLRSEVIWEKTRRMPDPARDRPAKTHEHLFLLVNGRRSAYWAGSDPDVWRMPPASSSGRHFARYPIELARRCIAASCPPGGEVLDPFFGSGATGVAAHELGMSCTGIDVVDGRSVEKGGSNS